MGFKTLIFFTNLSFMEFHVRYLALFCHFFKIDGFKCFSMRSLCKKIQFMLVFLKGPLFFPCFSFLIYINDHLDNAICKVAIYTGDSALYSKYD